MSTRVDTPTPGFLPPDQQARLRGLIEQAVRGARRAGRPRIVSLTVASPLDDPTAAVVTSQVAGEAWFVLEQPDRGGLAVAALGAVRILSSQGPNRFEHVSAEWRQLVGQALADPPGQVPGSGMAAFGGFAFADDGGASARWRGFAPASLVLPELSLARQHGKTWLTINLDIAADDTVEDALARVLHRCASLRQSSLPLLDPSPVRTPVVRSAMPPSHYEHAVARAVERIRRGQLEKVVLAREVEVHAEEPPEPGALLGVLREAFPSCFVYAVGRGEHVFLGATPELLVRRQGQRASSVALAGSSRRSADPAVDAHLGEQLLASAKDREENAIVARRIEQTLRPHAVWVTAAPEPSLIRVANIQHLAAPVRAQLARPLAAIELAGLLHPTPAVGGEPRAVALEAIPALEGMDRGWYAGPVGWTDSAEDGEFCVALRCALVHGAEASCYAGCGIVRDSDPAAELAESEVKLGALLPLLAG